MLKSKNILRSVIIQLFFCGGLIFLVMFFYKNIWSDALISNPEKLSKIFENKKTVCFGRFLIDVPLSATVVYGPTEAPIPIEILSESSDNFLKVIESKLSEIQVQREFVFGDLKEKDSMLGAVIDGQNDQQKIIFGVRKSTGDDYRIYSYFKDGDKIFLTSMFSGTKKKDYQKVINRLNGISKLISARADLDIPLAPGICINGGFVADSNELTHESITLGIRLTEFPDVHFSISTTMKNSLIESDALEPRISLAEEDARRTGNAGWYSRIKFFRRGGAKIDSWTGYQILALKPPQDGQKESYEFAFLSQGEPRNPYLPVLDVKLQSGVLNNKVGQINPSISDEEALEIWDKLTHSIRKRPTF